MATVKISALPAASSIDGVADVLPIVQSGITNKISRNTFLGITGSPVGNTDTQTLSSKTLDNTNAITVKDGSLTIQNSSITSKKMVFSLSSISAGQTRTITVPDNSLTLVGTTISQTLTNKTLTAPTITGPAITGTVSGAATYSTPTLTVPVVSDFSSATHTHASTAQGGTLSITAGGASSVLKDQSGLALDIEARDNATFAYFVESGCIWTAGAGLLASMTSGVVWINGRRISVSAATNHGFTASKDTYVDVDTSGSLVFNEVANNAASQAANNNRLRLAIIVTTGAAIGFVNQGQVDTTLASFGPTVASNFLTVSDSLGTLIYPTSPLVGSGGSSGAGGSGLLGYRQITAPSGNTTNSTVDVDIVGLDQLAVTVPANRKIKLSALVNIDGTVAGDIAEYKIKEGSTTLCTFRAFIQGTGGHGVPCPAEVTLLPTGGTQVHTYKFSHNRGAGTGTNTVETYSSGPIFIKAELV